MKPVKKTKSAGKTLPSETKAVSVRLEAAVWKAEAAESTANAAKVSLKKARKAFKLARKAAKAARKEMKVLQKAFEESISKANGKSAASVRKVGAEFCAAAKSASHEPAPSKRRPSVKRKRAPRTSPAVSAVPLVVDAPQAELDPAAVLDDSPPAVAAEAQS